MKLSIVKQAIRDSDRETVEKLIDRLGEAVVAAGLTLDILPENIEEAYAGEYRDAADFAISMAEEVGGIDFSKLQWPFTCINWNYAGKELMYDYCEENGHYFRNL